MTENVSSPSLVAPVKSSLLSHILPLLLIGLILGLLLTERVYYLTHFGFLYTDSDQATLWYQADDIAHGIFREPCFYGQSYNVALEAYVAAPLLWFHVPAPNALPIATTILSLFPFVVIAGAAYRKGFRYAASAVLALPLALPIDYVAIVSMPRGFVTGVSVAGAAVALWMFSDSRRAFFVAAFLAIISLAINPSGAIILLASGVYALLRNWKRLRFYLYSLYGFLAAAPFPVFLYLFYKYHPECDAYRPKIDNEFHWQTLKESFFIPDNGHFNHFDMNMFFGDFIPTFRGAWAAPPLPGNYGWVMLVILPVILVLLILFLRVRAAIAYLLAAAFTILSLGIDRIHSSSPIIFYPGTRMYLALPVLFAMVIVWIAGVRVVSPDKPRPGIYRRILQISATVLFVLSLAVFLTFASVKNYAALQYPSPLVPRFCLPPVETVAQLTTDAVAVSDACKKYNADLVLISDSRLTCFNEAGPSIANHAFETLYPFFERRTFLIKQERTKRHTAVLVYMPRADQITRAELEYPQAKIISRTPRLLLIPCETPGKTGMEIAESLGIAYRSNF